MKCPKCNGSGISPNNKKARCSFCFGTGMTDRKVVPMTNEEWLRSCPTQELIRFLMNVAYGGQIRNVQKNTFDEEAEKWSKWLEEKHTE